MTKYEKIKGYSIEEMAECISWFFDFHSDFPPCSCCVNEKKPCNHPADCLQGIVKWLESEAEENA